MTAGNSETCSRCGAAATGNFCAACGASLVAQSCAGCGTALAPGANFCHRCGTAAGGVRRPGAMLPTPAGSLGSRTPWIIAATLSVLAVAAVVYSANKGAGTAAPAVPSMANAGNGAVTGVADGPGTLSSAGGVPVGRAPDISSMSPRERFVKLEGKITQALQAGDTNTVVTFTPMALGAYAQLPDSDRDIDVRYHAAMLNAQVGLFDPARALADTILKQAPGNLFGYYIRATVAEFSGDSVGARTARNDFRAHYDVEIKKPRPEYAEHLPFLQQYRQGDGAK